MKAIGAVLVAILLFIFYTSSYAARTYGAKLCQQSDYGCYKVKRGDTWNSLFPGEYERDIVKRINRTNQQLYVGSIIAVPKNLDRSNYMDYAPFSKDIGPQESKVIIVDPSRLAYGAYDSSGQLVHWGPMSGGQGWCSDVRRGCKTPNGNFKIYNKGGPGCISSKYPLGEGGAPMPHCMYFKGGYAIHGSPKVPGYNASHGCVRVFNEDAQWLNREFIDTGSTKVIVKPYGQQLAV